MNKRINAAVDCAIVEFEAKIKSAFPEISTTGPAENQFREAALAYVNAWINSGEPVRNEVTQKPTIPVDDDGLVWYAVEVENHDVLIGDDYKTVYYKARNALAAAQAAFKDYECVNAVFCEISTQSDDFVVCNDFVIDRDGALQVLSLNRGIYRVDGAPAKPKREPFILASSISDARNNGQYVYFDVEDVILNAEEQTDALFTLGVCSIESYHDKSYMSGHPNVRSCADALTIRDVLDHVQTMRAVFQVTGIECVMLIAREI